MRSVIKWAINNSPALNLFVIALMSVGAMSLIVMPREVFPNFELEILLVTVPFPGATPDEVEEGICQKIEAAVVNLDGVKKVTSISQENFGNVVIELQSYVKDPQKILNDVRSQIDQISTFPPRSEDPEIKQIVFRAPAITIGLIGPERSSNPKVRLNQENQLRALAESIREDLLNLNAVPPKSLIRRPFAGLFQPSGSAISSAEIVAAKPYEISVEVPESTLQEYGLSLSRLANLIRMQNIEIPGGKMETPAQELLLRGKAKREIGSEIAEIPVLTRPNGDVVTVGDLGMVVDGFEESVSEHVINGRPGLAIRVSKTANEDLFTVVETVRDYVENRSMPDGYEMRVWGDVSIDVKDRVRLLTTNGIQGLVVVFIILALFLDLRLAFWVALGIPISILGTGLVLVYFGQTLNMLSMFAFLMALGIVVDDAIVIGENIYEKRQEGMNPVKASLEGTLEVLPSVAASVSTTIIAIFPLMFVSGVMGKFLAVMPLAMIGMLCISLLEALFVLPSHLAHENNLFLRMMSSVFYILKPLTYVVVFLNKIVTRLLNDFICRIYQPMLEWCLNNRLITLTTAVGILVINIGLIAGGIAKMGFFPEMDARDISATVAFPNGTSADFARDATLQLEAAIRKVDDELREENGGSSIVNVYRRIGEVGDSGGAPTGVTNGSHVATVEIQLTPPEERAVHSKTIVSKWREAVPEIPGIEALKFNARSMGPGSGGIEFMLLANDAGVDYLERAAEECKEYLATKEGVSDIEDDAREGKAEMVLRLNDTGKALGLDENVLANTIRGSYFGEEVQRLQRGRHEVKLMVRYPKDSRKTMEGFENIRVRGNDNLERPISEVATVEFKRSFAEIKRLNQRRSITVTASVDRAKGNAPEIIAEMKSKLIPDLQEKYFQKYGVAIGVNWEGEAADTAESFNSMGVGFLIAMMCMYILLTLEFRSYLQPMIIMSIIPFGWIGAVLGHILLDLELGFFSMFGLIALTGVIVNDSIVLVDFINHRIRDGLPHRQALVEAGMRRFRPILLTSATTVGGLTPMLFETSMQAQVLIPMAAALIFGLSTGTVLILILVPTMYSTYLGALSWFGVSMVAEVDEEAYASPSKPFESPGGQKGRSLAPTS